MAFEQGTPDRIPPDQPDPVLVGPGLSTLGEGAYVKSATATPVTVPDEKPSEPVEASYFSSVPGTATTTKDAYIKSPISPAEAASGAASGPELLRRLSLVGATSPDSPVVTDPRSAHPGLHLSGRIISAAFCIPYRLSFSPESDWVWKYVPLS